MECRAPLDQLGQPEQRARPVRQEQTARRVVSAPQGLQAHRVHKGLPARRDRTDKPGQQVQLGRRGRALPAQQGQLAPLDPGAIPARPDLPERSQV